MFKRRDKPVIQESWAKGPRLDRRDKLNRVQGDGLEDNLPLFPSICVSAPAKFCVPISLIVFGSRSVVLMPGEYADEGESNRARLNYNLILLPSPGDIFVDFVTRAFEGGDMPARSNSCLSLSLSRSLIRYGLSF